MDDRWKLVEVEPEAVAINGNGANGHHDAINIGPTVELVMGNSHANGNGANGNAPASAPVNGNDHHDDEADRPQQSLFSWAEFMADEPVKPKGRSRKPQPATLSMFEWALTLEHERELIRSARDARAQTQGRTRRWCGVLPCKTMYAGFSCCPKSNP